MMSKTLSINLLKGEARRKLWLYIITVIVMLLIRPVRLLMSIDSVELWGPKLSQAEKLDQVIAFAKFTSGNNLIPLFVFAIAFAFACFGYMYSKSKIDLYHSIPLKRKTMYGVFSASAILPYYLIEILTFAANISILAMKGLLTSFSLRIVVSTFLYNLIVFVMIYSITAIAIFLTGQILTGVLGTLTFIFAWTCVVEMFESYKGFAYQTYLYDYTPSWIDFVLSPLTATSRLKPWLGNCVAELIVLFVETIILFVIGLVLYNMKPSDSVNKGLSYKILNPIIRIPCVICLALVGGLYVAYLSNSLTAGWFWGTLVVAGIISHCLINGLIHSDIKKAMNNWIQLIISLAVAAVIAVFFIYDLGGYDSYIPKADKVEYASVDFANLHDDMSYFELEEGAGGYNLVYEDMAKHRLNAMKTNDITSVIELANLGIKNLDERKSAFARRDEENGNNGEIVYKAQATKERAVEGAEVEYAEDDYSGTMEDTELTYDEPINFVRIRYHLKSGRDVYRSYNINIDDSFDVTEKIYNTPEYKDSILQIDDVVNNNKIYKVSATYGTGETAFTLKEDQALAFVDAIKKDYRDATLAEMAKERPICGIYSQADENSYEDYLYGYYIYPSFNNTLALLESYNIKVNTEVEKLDIDRISSVVVTRYNYETGDQKQVTYEKGTDDEMLKTFQNIMIMDNYSYVNSILKKYEQNVDVECNYLADNGYLSSYYMRVERGDMPKEVLEELGFIVQ